MKNNNILIRGPFNEYNSSQGTSSLLMASGERLKSAHRQVWYISRPTNNEELDKSLLLRTLKEKSLGVIIFAKNRHSTKKYVINRLFPIRDFSTFKQALNFLVKNDGKLVFCS